MNARAARFSITLLTACLGTAAAATTAPATARAAMAAAAATASARPDARPQDGDIRGGNTQAQDGDQVTIYRCTGADGTVSIGNVPCAGDARQEVRSMARPQDAPAPPAPPPAATAPAAQAPAPAAVVQHVVVAPPQPLYECVRPDGSVYESDSGQGEVRWVPLWTTGWPVGGWHGGGGHGGRPGRPGRPTDRGDIGTRGATTPAGSGLSAPPVSRISIPPDPPRPDPGAAVPPRPRPPHGGWVGPEPGAWERDACHPLPQAKACARLRDRREAIRTRFFNAQQRERDTLRVEERGLNARIDRDCRT